MSRVCSCLDAELALRAWFPWGISVAVSQPTSLRRTVRVDGDEVPVEGGRQDMTLRAAALLRWGRIAGGPTLSAQLPTGAAEVTTARADVVFGAVAAVDLVPGTQPFVTLQYGMYSASTRATATGDVITARLGLNQRWHRMSLVPTLEWQRNAGVPDLGLAPYRVMRARMLAAYEPVANLSLMLSAEYARASDRAIGAQTSAGASDVVVGAGVTYVWEAWRFSRHHREPPPPATIRVVDVAGDRAWRGADLEESLRGHIGRLRLATLAAERDAGGADGRIEVTLVADRAGRVVDARIVDGVGAPALAAAVERYWRSATLPAPASRATLRFNVVFR